MKMDDEMTRTEAEEEPSQFDPPDEGDEMRYRVDRESGKGRTLRVPLTADDYEQRSRRLAELTLEILADEETHREEGREYNNARKAKQKQVRELAYECRHNSREASVQCDVYVDLHQNTHTLVRTDTGAIVATRALTARERTRYSQRNLPLDEQPVYPVEGKWPAGYNASPNTLPKRMKALAGDDLESAVYHGDAEYDGEQYHVFGLELGDDRTRFWFIPLTAIG